MHIFHFGIVHGVIIQIMIFFINSKSKRVVGDSIESFYNGDMEFMGPRLPHV